MSLKEVMPNEKSRFRIFLLCDTAGDASDRKHALDLLLIAGA